MDVGAHQRKGVEGTPGGGNIVAELIDVSLPIRLIGTEIASIYSPDNHVVQGARCVQAGVSRHEPILYFRQGRCQYNSHWETTSPKLVFLVFVRIIWCSSVNRGRPRGKPLHSPSILIITTSN